MSQIYTLSIYGQGVVTLPKNWRDKLETNKLMASEQGEKLILEPLSKDTGLKMITNNPSFDFLKDEPDLYS